MLIKQSDKKIKNMKQKSEVMLSIYIKSRGTGGTKMSANNESGPPTGPPPPPPPTIQPLVSTRYTYSMFVLRMFGRGRAILE